MAGDALELVTTSASDTERVAAALAAELRAGDVLALHGELGGGKTCFVRGLARGLGVVGDVSSPTFTLMQTYPGRIPLYHLDAWMQARGEAFLSDGGAEWLTGEGVAAVEWADRVQDWLPAERFEVSFGHLGGERRRLALRWTGTGERLAAVRRAQAALESDQKR